MSEWEERHKETDASFAIMIWVMLGFAGFVLVVAVFFQYVVRPHTQPFVHPSGPVRPIATEEAQAEQKAAIEAERAKAQEQMNKQDRSEDAAP